jgi:hypothetical protein
MIKVFDAYPNKYFSGEYFLKKAGGRGRRFHLEGDSTPYLMGATKFSI